MNIGRMRHRVTFQDPIAAQDAAGQPIITWVDSFPVPVSAEIMPLSGKELVSAQALQSKVSVRMRVRYRPGYSTAMRAVHRGLVYNIEGVIPDPESGIHWLTLLCSMSPGESA